MLFIAFVLFAFAAVFHEFALPLSQSPALITAAPAGGAYFATNSSVDFVTYSGGLASYHPGSPTFTAYGPGVQIAPNGEIWFMGSVSDIDGTPDLSIGRMRPGGGFAGILNGSGAGSFVYDPKSENFIVGPDGRAWLSTCHQFCSHGTFITVLSPSSPPLAAEFDFTYGDSYAVGPDGRVYITEVGLAGVNQVARVNTTGHIVQHYALPQLVFSGSPPGDGIARGPDGNMWLVENNKNAIARIKLSTGVVTHFAIPSAHSDARTIAAGADGTIWFTEHATNKLGRITTSGVISEIPLPHPGSGPFGIAACTGVPFAFGHGCMWVTEETGHRVARVNF